MGRRASEATRRADYDPKKVTSLSALGATPWEIGKKLHISPGTVQRILERVRIAADPKEVARMSAAGMTTQEIGKKLRISKGAVCRILQKVPLPPGSSRWGTKATSERKQEFLRAYEETRNARTACRQCGIAGGTHVGWLKKDPEFAAAFEKSREKFRQQGRVLPMVDHVEISRMKATGMSARQIGMQLGTSSTAVSRILKRNQIQAVYDMAQRGLTTKCTSSRIMSASEAQDIFGL